MRFCWIIRFLWASNQPHRISIFHDKPPFIRFCWTIRLTKWSWKLVEEMAAKSHLLILTDKLMIKVCSFLSFISVPFSDGQMLAASFLHFSARTCESMGWNYKAERKSRKSSIQNGWTWKRGEILHLGLLFSVILSQIQLQPTQILEILYIEHIVSHAASWLRWMMILYLFS